MYQIRGDKNILEEWNTNGSTTFPQPNWYGFNTVLSSSPVQAVSELAKQVNYIKILRIPSVVKAPSKMLFLPAQYHLILSTKKCDL